MRIPASIMTAGFALATVAGCGASDPPAKPAHTSILRSRAHAVAPLLTIRQADLPEFKVTAHPATAQEAPEAVHETKCVRPPASQGASGTRGTRTVEHPRQPGRRGSPSRPGRRGARSQPGHRASPSQRPWASAKSERLSANGGYHLLGASSHVSIMPTSAAVRAEVAEAKNLDETCVEHALRGRLAKEHLRLPVSGVVVEPLSVNVQGADASVAYRIIVGYRGAPLVAYMDAIELAYGQDLIELFTYHSSKPVPPAMDERLLGLLVARAKSHNR